MSDCDKCGLEDNDCRCYIRDLEKRIEFLEEELDKLTFIVEKIHETLLSLRSMS